MYIRIRGNEYNISEFRHIHPGGSELLELCVDEPDCTALFESYHAFCDESGIVAIMRKYERGAETHGAAHHGAAHHVVNNTQHEEMFSFKPDGFYNTVR